MQAKVKVENDLLTWKLLANGGGSYPLRSVTGIQYEKGPMMAWMSNIVVLAAGGDNKRIQVPKSDKSEQIVQSINQFIRQFHEKESQKNATLSTATQQAPSVADELIKLAALKEQGILTESEFQEQKQKILNR